MVSGRVANLRERDDAQWNTDQVTSSDMVDAGDGWSE